MSSYWEVIASKRANSILDKIPLEWRLSQDDLAYAKSQKNLKTSISRFLNNPCLLNIMIPEALEKAERLDRLHQNNMPKGVLHGLPISLKDQFHVKGSDTTMGYVGWIGTFEGDGESEKVGRVDSEIVAQLESMGAVVFCKYDETTNNIIGQTLNPVSMGLSCGGSSGGEAALIAVGGSSLGLGTDIAGSVRVPAAFCGIYGIKPSSGRFSYRDVANTVRFNQILIFPVLEAPLTMKYWQNPGQTLIPSVVGFLSSSIIGLEIIMSALFPLSPTYRSSQEPFSWKGSQCVISSKPVSSLVQGDRLKFGIMWCDGMIEPHPPVRRGLQMVVDALRNVGHEVEFFPKSAKLFGLIYHSR
ncbi:general amidase protein [Rutstroemia sp. NJR-2017a WRK4]|nr:general amidase protein [Rutstroemia sp. NJR-2017a WRK4]